MKKIFSVVISLLLVFCLAGCEERFDPAPQIKEGEFPFVVEYEMNGERYLIEDALVCTFDGYGINNFAIFGYPTPRSWSMKLKKTGKEHFNITLIDFEDNTESLLVKNRINNWSSLRIYLGSGGYYMGDTDRDKDNPKIEYVEEYTIIPNWLSEIDSTMLSNEELEKYFGIKIIRFEFSEPIENKFE